MTECFECGAPAAHRHHVVPRSLGGTKTVPLCEGCHAKVHGRRHLVVTIEPVPLGRTPIHVRRWLPGLVVMLWASGVSIGHGGINIWTSIGLEGENILALALDPLTPTTLYAGLRGSGVYKSVDGAGS